MDNKLTWAVGINKVADFKILIKYLAPKETAEGKYALIFDDHYTERMVKTTEKNTDVVTEVIFTVPADIGIHSLKISPLSFGKSELMKLLEVQLIPIVKQ